MSAPRALVATTATRTPIRTPRESGYRCSCFFPAGLGLVAAMDVGTDLTLGPEAQKQRHAVPAAQGSLVAAVEELANRGASQPMEVFRRARPQKGANGSNGSSANGSNGTSNGRGGTVTMSRNTRSIGEHASTLTDLLLRSKCITLEDVESAAAVQSSTGLLMGELLVSRGALSAAALTKGMSDYFGIEAYNPSEVPSRSAVQLVPRQIATDYVVLPISVEGKGDGDVLRVAMARAQDAELINFLEHQTGKRVVPLVAATSQILEAIPEAYGSLSAMGKHVEAFDAATGHRIAERDKREELESITENAPVVRIVSILIAEGLRQRASDIHIEPEEDHVRIRYRIDGTLQEVQKLPGKMGPALASRIKVMCDLDIVERHRSQDGQMVVSADGREVDVRVATAETLWGEKIVMRLLDRARSIVGMEELGMPDWMVEAYRQVTRIPFGLVVVAGPTGAGKTTTLYASLNELDRRTRNITTIEDPVEYVFPGIVQMPIKEAAGRTFASGLRAVLRQDPDVVLIGEVRDRETAEIASQAALTGHTVFCSLHATDCVSAVFRFLDMGVESYLISPALEGIVSQRLVRRICTQCVVAYEPAPYELSVYQYLTGSDRNVFWRGAGCNHCSGTGYYERVGIYEFLRLDDNIRNLIVRSAPQNEIREAANEAGMVTLLQSAVQKVDEGITTIEEVIRTVYGG